MVAVVDRDDDSEEPADDWHRDILTEHETAADFATSKFLEVDSWQTTTTRIHFAPAAGVAVVRVTGERIDGFTKRGVGVDAEQH
ncbi:MAG: hypothetical protein AABO58_00175 [Acidobacteriota bacterium]